MCRRREIKWDCKCRWIRWDRCADARLPENQAQGRFKIDCPNTFQTIVGVIAGKARKEQFETNIDKYGLYPTWCCSSACCQADLDRRKDQVDAANRALQQLRDGPTLDNRDKIQNKPSHMRRQYYERTLHHLRCLDRFMQELWETNIMRKEMGGKEIGDRPLEIYVEYGGRKLIESEQKVKDEVARYTAHITGPGRLNASTIDSLQQWDNIKLQLLEEQSVVQLKTELQGLLDRIRQQPDASDNGMSYDDARTNVISLELELNNIERSFRSLLIDARKTEVTKQALDDMSKTYEEIVDLQKSKSTLVNKALNAIYERFGCSERLDVNDISY